MKNEEIKKKLTNVANKYAKVSIILRECSQMLTNIPSRNKQSEKNLEACLRHLNVTREDITNMIAEVMEFGISIPHNDVTPIVEQAELPNVSNPLNMVKPLPTNDESEKVTIKGYYRVRNGKQQFVPAFTRKRSNPQKNKGAANA